MNSMIKQKLISKRKQKGFSQMEMAHLLNMEQSQYSRRETGITRISTEEWQSISKVLSCDVEDVFESSESIFIANNSTTNGSIGVHNVCQNQSDFTIEVLKKYILKLEEEVSSLKKGL